MIYTYDGQTFNINQKQKIFADHFVKTGNLARSYWKAYYEEKGADYYDPKTLKQCSNNGARLRDNEGVKDYLTYLNKRIEEDTISTAKERQQQLTLIHRGNPDAFYYIDKDVDGDEVRRYKRVDWEKLDPMKALDMLNRMQNSYNEEEKQDININIGFDDDFSKYEKEYEEKMEGDDSDEC